MTDNAAAALALAKQYDIPVTTPEDVDDGLDGWMEDVGRPLMPGLDIRDGKVFQTHKIVRKVTVPPKRKGEDPTVDTVPTLVCVTSDREVFRYDKERISALGYEYPRTVTIPSKQRWQDKNIKAWRDGTDKPWPLDRVYQNVRETFVKYVEFADEIYYDLMSLYTMASYVFRAFPVSGYIHMNGSAGSGKTQTLKILDAIGFNPMLTAGISEAAMFRSVAGNPGLMLLDETEKFEGERGESVRRMLLAGYVFTGTNTRAERDTSDGPWEAREFSVYCPKAFASIEPLDGVLGSRCLVVQMRPAVRTIPSFPNDPELWRETRNQLYLWSLYHGVNIQKSAEEWEERRLTEAAGIQSRNWEVASQMVVLSDYIIGKELSEKVIEFFANYYKKSSEAADAVDRVRILLRSLPRVLAEKQPWQGNFYSLKEIHDIVIRYMEEDSLQYYKTRNTGKALDTLGFRDRKARPGGVHVKLEEARIKQEMKQRRVEPFPEDEYWLANDDATWMHEEQPMFQKEVQPPEQAEVLDLDWDALLEENEA